MSEVTEIKIQDNGPICVEGDFDIIDADGNKMNLGKKIYLCRCGNSGNKPFCDGSHKKV